MRFNPTLLLSLSLISLSLASYDQQAGIFRRDLCTENGQTDCDDNCMPVGAVCCHEWQRRLCCDAGLVCNANGCCPPGEECIGGGTMTYDISLTGTGALPTGGPAATAGNTYTVAALDTSTTSAAGSTVQAHSTPSTTKVTVSTNTAASGGQSTPAAQAGGASGGHSRGSGLYAMAVLAAGQFLLM